MEGSKELIPSHYGSIASTRVASRKSSFSRFKTKVFVSYALGVFLFGLFSLLLKEFDPKPHIYKGSNVQTDLHTLDSCTGSLESTTSCCSSVNYPVLGGVDVVSMRDVHRGNPPLLGTIDYAAALPTSYGTFVFFFRDKLNQAKFLADPWLYAPKWGGFDGFQLADNNKLKGDGAKEQLGPRSDLSTWMISLDNRLQMFGSEDGKRDFMDDMKHFGDKADRKWLDWYGKLEEGPFNTQCFQGTTAEALTDATAKYSAGELPLGVVDALKERLDFLTQEGSDPWVLKNALATGQVFYVNQEQGRVESLKLQDQTYQTFFVEHIAKDQAESVTVDIATNAVLWTCPSEGAIKRTLRSVIDGSYGAPQTVVSGLSNPTYIEQNQFNGKLYWVEGNAIRWTMGDGSTDFKAEELTEAEGTVTSLAMDAEHLYFIDSGAGKLKRVSIAEDAPASLTVETVVTELASSAASLAMTHGAVYYLASESSVYRTAKEPNSAPRLLFTASSPITSLEVHFGRMYFVMEGQLLSGEVKAIMNAGTSAAAVSANNFPAVSSMHVDVWASPAGLDFSLNTKYTERGDAQPFSDYPWASGPIVELYQPTTLRVKAPSADFSYEWIYRGHIYTSHAIQVTLKHVGDYPVTLRETNMETGESNRELRVNLVGRYVRRELRSLLDEDREAFFQGLEVMVKTSMEEGKEQYGPNFKNNDYFVHLHNVLAGARDCDHLHLGRGFLFNHVGITLEMEQALQVVNPALTVPFWDFTIDSHGILTEHDGDWNKLWESPVFDPQWFGDCHNEYQTVVEGRWAWALKIPVDQWDNQVRNSYGMLRSPWNNNPFPYVQRFHEISGVPVFELNDGFPTCKHHFFVNVAHSKWMDYVQKVSSEPHGTVHGVLGGVKNDHHTFEELSELISEKDVLALRVRSPHAPKEIWRSDLMECPEFCDMETPAEECKCNCGPNLMERMEDPDTFDAYVAVGLATRFKYSYDKETVKQAMDIVCNAGYIIGDQEESASPADPIFWPIHPTIERLFMWKLLNGGFEDAYWPEDENYTGPMRESLIKECKGHNPQDLLPWKMKMAGDQDATQYTNREMFDLSDPEGAYRMPYVYDNFKWPHCVEEGFDFDTIGWVKF